MTDTSFQRTGLALLLVDSEGAGEEIAARLHLPTFRFVAPEGAEDAAFDVAVLCGVTSRRRA